MTTTLDDNTIAGALGRVGLRRGVPVLMHNSLNEFGYGEDGVKAVIKGLLKAIGPQGTLLVPTLTGTALDGPDHPPIFDRQESRSRTGCVSEALRQWPGALRSLHVTHSVAAFGRLADWIIRDHWRASTPCELGTPFSRVASEGGQILLMGVDWSHCTSILGVEEVAGVPYRMQPEPTTVTMTDGERTVVAECHLQQWYSKSNEDFNRLEPLVARAEGVRKGGVGAVEVTVIEAEKLWTIGIHKLREDPWFLLAKP